MGVDGYLFTRRRLPTAIAPKNDLDSGHSLKNAFPTLSPLKHHHASRKTIAKCDAF
jgi:hypothetical protein